MTPTTVVVRAELFMVQRNCEKFNSIPNMPQPRSMAAKPYTPRVSVEDSIAGPSFAASPVA